MEPCLSPLSPPWPALSETINPPDLSDPEPPSWPFSFVYVGANYTGSKVLSLDKEVIAIKDAMLKSLGKNVFDQTVDFKVELCANTSEFFDLLEKGATVLHIGCHGEKDCLHFKDSTVDMQTIVDIISELQQNPEPDPSVFRRFRLVVVNACTSYEIARRLSEVVDFVVGLTGKVQDHRAIQFSSEVYKKLLKYSLEESFKWAKCIDKERYRLLACRVKPSGFSLAPPQQNRSREPTQLEQLKWEEVVALFCLLEIDSDVIKILEKEKVPGFQLAHMGQDRLMSKLKMSELQAEKVFLAMRREIPMEKIYETMMHRAAHALSPSNDTYLSDVDTEETVSIGDERQDGLDGWDMIAAKHPGQPEEFMDHMRVLVTELRVVMSIAHEGSEEEHVDLDFGGGNSQRWTYCMLLWLQFAKEASTDEPCRKRWRDCVGHRCRQDRLLQELGVWLQQPQTRHPDWSLASFSQWRCEKQHAACVFITDRNVQRQLESFPVSRQDWTKNVVSEWFDNDEPASAFLSRANRFLQGHLIEGVEVLEKVIPTHSYVAFMFATKLAARLLFAFLEAHSISTPAASSAGATASGFHGFCAFVSSDKSLFFVPASAEPSSTLKAVIVQGLRCLSHLATSQRDLLGPIRPLVEFVAGGATLQQSGGLSQTARDALWSLEAEIVPSLHVDLISAAREVMERRSNTECVAAAAEFQAAEQHVRTVRNAIAEAMEGTKDEEVEVNEELARERDEAVALLEASGEKLLGVRGSKQTAAAQHRLTYLRQELLRRVHVIRAALAGSAGTPLASTQDPDQALSSFLQAYDGWLARQQDTAVGDSARTEQEMSDLAESLRSFDGVLEHRQPAASLPHTQEDAGLATAMARQESWFAQASCDYAREVQAHALAACTALADKLKREELSLVQLLAASENAARVVEMGSNPRQELLERLKGLHAKYEEAEEEFARAQFEMERVRKKRKVSEEAEARMKEEFAKAASVLSGVRSDIRKAWVWAYTLAAGAYPELPAEVIRHYSSISEGLHSADGGRLFCPCSSLEQYQDLAKVSAAGANHIVRTGVVSEDGREVTVVLKEFDLGPTSDGVGMQKRCRTMQREVDTLANLEHPNVIQVQLFFLEEDKNRLLCHVQFPLFPGGDVERWLQTDEGKEQSKVQVVVLDALRGLEHLHYHGIVHCNVKPANVLLTEVQPDGHRRAVLADFDLSLDQQQRRQHTSAMSSASMLTGGPRGTPGLLTLAPEVTAGGQEPTAASDMFSFGGLALLALCATQAQAWQAMAPAELWDGQGRPRLEGVPPLVRRLLSRKPTARPSASQALADDWFAAMGVAEQSSVQSVGGPSLNEQEMQALVRALVKQAGLVQDKGVTGLTPLKSTQQSEGVPQEPVGIVDTPPDVSLTMRHEQTAASDPGLDAALAKLDSVLAKQRPVHLEGLAPSLELLSRKTGAVDRADFDTALQLCRVDLGGEETSTIFRALNSGNSVVGCTELIRSVSPSLSPHMEASLRGLLEKNSTEKMVEKTSNLRFLLQFSSLFLSGVTDASDDGSAGGDRGNKDKISRYPFADGNTRALIDRYLGGLRGGSYLDSATGEARKLEGESVALSLFSTELGDARAVEEGLICPISKRLMNEPVTCSDEKTYELANIKKWFSLNGTSPITRAALAYQLEAGERKLVFAYDEGVLAKVNAFKQEMDKEEELRMQEVEGKEEERITRARYGHGSREDDREQAGGSLQIGSPSELVRRMLAQQSGLACVIGPPASGKTVTVLQIVDAVASHCSDALEQNAEGLFLPIFVRASELSALLLQKEWESGAANLKQLMELFLAGDERSGLVPEGMVQVVGNVDLTHLFVCIDGLDECGGNREVIENVIDDAVEAARTSHEPLHVLLSTREHTYSHSRKCCRLAGFDVFRVQPLDKARQVNIIRSRIQPDKVALFGQQLALAAEYNPELGTSPFLLNLMIEVFRKDNELPTQRAKLYCKQVDVIVSRCITANTDTLFHLFAGDESTCLKWATEYLEAVAFVCQLKLERRDFTVAAAALGIKSIWQNDPALLAPLCELLFKPPIVGLVTCVRPVAELGKKVFRFSHLTIQEFLAARCAARIYSNDVIGLMEVLGPLHSRWRIEVVQFIACLLDEKAFTDFCKAVVYTDDGAGAACELVRKFLKERGGPAEVWDLLREKLLQSRGHESLITGLCHVSQEMRDLVLSEMQHSDAPARRRGHHQSLPPSACRPAAPFAVQARTLGTSMPDFCQDCQVVE